MLHQLQALIQLCILLFLVLELSQTGMDFIVKIIVYVVS
jgi:hypothetical protein